MGKWQRRMHTLAVLFIAFSFYLQASTLPKKLVEWAHTNHIIKVGIDSNFIPFDYIDKNKKPAGIGEHTRQKLSKILPIDLQVSSISNFEQEYNNLLKGKIDIISSCILNQNKNKQVLFSTPLLYMTPILIVTQNKAIKNGNDLNRYHKIAIIKKNAPTDYKKYITDHVLNVSTATEGYQLVENGKIDAFISYLYLYQYTKSKNDFKNLRALTIAGLKPMPIGFCVNKKKPELVKILNWGINNLDKSFILPLQQQWRSIHASENRLKNHKNLKNIHVILTYITTIFVIIILIGIFFSKRLINIFAHTLDTKYFRFSFFSVLSIIVLSLLAANNRFLSEYKKQITLDQQAFWDLSQNTTQKAFAHWYRKQQKSVYTIINDPKFINFTRQLVSATDNNNRILVNTIRKKMHDYFTNKYTITHQKITYTISSTNGKYILHYIKSLQGKASSIKSQRPALFKAILSGQNEFIPPVWEIANNINTSLKDREPEIFITSPIRNGTGNIIAIFGLRFDPNKDFSNLIIDKRLGQNFESYAIDSSGYLISDTRYSSALQKDSIIPIGKTTVLRVRLPNQAHNPIINDAKLAIDGNNFTGYLNYRGKEVVGQWFSLNAFNFTLVSEIKYSKMYSDYNYFRYLIMLGLIVTGSLVFAFSLLILTIAKRANKISKRYQNELMQQVEKRTKELTTSERRNKLINSSIADGVVGVDRQGNIIFANQSALDIASATEQSMLSRNIMDLLTIINSPVKSFEQTQIYKSITTSQIIRVAHIDVIFTLGSMLSLELSIAPIENDDSELAAVLVFREISEHLKATEQIEKILENLPICVLIINQDNKIEQINHAGTLLVGYPRNEIIGKSADYFVNSEFVEQQKKMVKEFFRNPDTFNSKNYYQIFQLTNKAGKVIDATRVYTPVHFHDGIKAIVLIRDVSLEIKAKKALIEAKNLADDTNRIKSNFLANMSHEIRTPMNAILGMSHLALSCNLENKPHQYITKVHGAAESLLRIINDILDVSKIEACKLEIENINCSIYSIFYHLSSILGFKAFEKKLELLFSISSDVPDQIISDPLRLGQILINLLSNAIKFTEQGQIIVSLKLAAQKQLGKTTLEFAVQDTGIGLSQAQQKNLFQSFNQADSSTTRKYGGTGLGLSISKNLIELMGGKVHLDSKEGHGSTFSFTIVCEISPLSDKLELLKQATSLPHYNILIVDDNLCALDILKSILLSFNCNVSTASSGKTAIDIINHASLKFDFVMVDSNMPELDGIKTCQIIKDKYGYTDNQFILITSNSGDDLAFDQQQHNIKAVIVKPVLAKNLLNELQDLKNKNFKPQSISQKNKTKLQEYQQLLTGYKILVVEDNLLNQELTVALLSEAQIEIQCANNGQEAVDLVKQQKFDCILMDLQMPIMDGYMATKIIRKTHVNLPIIAMSANVSTDTKAHALEVGMNEHIGKPINLHDMFATICKWVLQRAPINIDIFPPETLTAAPTNTLPNFRHIDVGKGILIANNDLKLYLKLLDKFIKGQLEFQQNFKNAMETAQQEVVIRLVHTLKGSAANIGALKLHRISEKLESSCKNIDNHHIKTLFAQTTEQLNNVLTELTDYFLLQNKEQPHIALTEFTFTNSLITEIERLLELVTQFETEAAEAAQVISLQLQSAKISAEFDKIVKQIDNYDFSRAQISLKLFIKKIKLESQSVED
ncbi:MAG: response regulator [Psychromonas sp.]|nr:response regulator [Psychromonas sp.]